MKYYRIQLEKKKFVLGLLPLNSCSTHSHSTEKSNTRVSSVDAGRGIWSSASVVPFNFVHSTHLVESSESPAFLGSSGLLSSSSRSASFSADSDPPPPSLPAGPDGPGKQRESEDPGHSVGAAVCMIFWRTSRIFSCKHTLVGKISAYRAWNAAVAWATEEKKKKEKHM